MEKPQSPPPKPPSVRGWRHSLGLGVLLLIAAAAGWVFERMGAPLPWMIGPLVVTAAIFMGPAPQITVPTRLRPVGQVVVATQVGLAFSPEALDLLLGFAPVIIGAALATGLCILAVSILVSHLTGQSVAQTFLSSVPTSPVEAASMARAAGINPTPVIFSQTLRMAAVVLILPFALYALDGWPDVHRQAVGFALPDPGHILWLVAIGVAGALLFRVLRVPNPNFLGPMAAAALLAVSGNGPVAYPPDILALAQILLGTWLGATFRREFMTSALRLTLISAGSSLLLLLLCSLSAVAIAIVSGVDWQTMVLGSAPGGVVEMALTARFLGQNVVLITTFHLVRIFIIMPNIPWIVRLLARYERRKTG
ncbi:AbrB family transcriptional regulator [Roseinatronobacter alkalisoli]|uniref:AbrB family transcriptional regulator n=1 Tax=Roseinatronobacter alkalisoli TaxID=3028235 RepID=A0ABT5TDE0_9RHOB|nr:AbrB family transcriptional regulator [Roseinatronobacter sp. HJB301]MDD7973119.1 AbrB family transcriptional regulator [Roseinatronobacter sp. HJB301]